MPSSCPEKGREVSGDSEATGVPASSTRLNRQWRIRPAWQRGWPLYPALIFLFVIFLYPVSQLLWLSLFGSDGHGAGVSHAPTHPAAGAAGFY